MTDLEDKIRSVFQDPRWDLPAWPDPISRVRRAAARQRARLAATTLVLLAAVVTPLALLPGLVAHGTGVKPLPVGTRHAPSARPTTPHVPSWAAQLGGEVAYKCWDSICLMRPDGTGKRTLAPAGPEWDLSWSPDGRRLAFRGYYGAGDGQYDLYRVDANGCHVTRLTHRMNGTSSSWSPTGRQIVFSVPLGLYVINANGSGLRHLLAGEKYAYGVDAPAWSKDNQIAYARYLPSQHRIEIYVVNADGSGNTALTRGAPGFGQPAWSADGKSIAFVANLAFGANPRSSWIDVATADGKGVHRVSPRSWISYSPTWTPGGKIVFLREIGGPNQSSAYIVNRDGSGLRLLYPKLDALQIAWGASALPKANC